MMCALDEQFVRSKIDDLFKRCRLARAAGGIALEEVMDGKKDVPEGWWLDFYTSYYLPPNFAYFEARFTGEKT